MAESSEEQQPRLEPRRQKPLEDADVYELNLDGDESTPPAKPASPKKRETAKSDSPGKPSRKASSSAAGAAGNEGDIYDLAEPEAPARKRTAAPLRPELDPRLGGGDSSAAEAPPAGGRSEAADKAAAEGKPVPKLYQSEPEPEYINPEVAKTRREEARIKAAQQWAEEDAARRRRKLITFTVLALLALLIYTWFWIF